MNFLRGPALKKSAAAISLFGVGFGAVVLSPPSYPFERYGTWWHQWRHEDDALGLGLGLVFPIQWQPMEQVSWATMGREHAQLLVSGKVCSTCSLVKLEKLHAGPNSPNLHLLAEHYFCERTKDLGRWITYDDWQRQKREQEHLDGDKHL